MAVLWLMFGYAALVYSLYSIFALLASAAARLSEQDIVVAGLG